ncbi:MAG: hypothetical protein KatS3mg068_1394 [Candidatus Sericytochromatia bacterium]|nr:MAG: hypothetical protein KatS3mg068_1394 [Candidatus Sericytochromatia bacterium]
MKYLKFLIIPTIIINNSCISGGNYIPSSLANDKLSLFKLISPVTELEAGKQIKILPIITNLDGSIPNNPNLIWKVSNENIAKIDKDGNLTALKDGKVTVTAIYNGKQTTLDLIIKKTGMDINNNPNQVSKIRKIVVKLPNQETPLIDYNIEKLGGTLQFEAIAYDSDNKKIDDLTFTWSSSNTSVAEVNSLGLVKALSSGNTNIIATIGDKNSNIVRVIVPNAQANLNVDFQGE